MKAFKQYVAVWRVPGAPLLLIVGTFARVGIGMISLALLLLVHNSTGSYATAAIATACYAIAGAALGPIWGRLADRFGPTRVLLVSGLAHPVALVGPAAHPQWTDQLDLCRGRRRGCDATRR